MSDKENERNENYYSAYLAHHNISRRGLFRSVVTGIKHSFHNENNNPIRTVARPPNASQEVMFLTQCDACQRCMQACTQQIIQWQDNTPVINLDYSFCNQCGECYNACTTGALTTEGDLSIDLIPQFMNTCNNKISGYCSVCAQSCPAQAINLISGQLPSIDTKLCNGCGVCSNACFINAITMQFSLKEHDSAR